MNKLEKELMEQIEISSDLELEYLKQPTYYASWARHWARAKDKVRKLKDREGVIFSELYSEYREDNRDAKENDCKSYIKTNNRYKELLTELRRAEYATDLLEVAKESFVMRKEMLSKIGKQYQAELEAYGLGGPKPNLETKLAAANRKLKRKAKRSK